MNALIIGGPRNGEWIEVLDGVRGWVDIRNATTHVIRNITWTLTDHESKPTEAFALHLAVHPEIVGPQEQAIAGQMLNLLAMAEFARAHGEKLEIPEEPSPVIIVPSTPAELFGPDGKPKT